MGQSRTAPAAAVCCWILAILQRRRRRTQTREHPQQQQKQQQQQQQYCDPHATASNLREVTAVACATLSAQTFHKIKKFARTKRKQRLRFLSPQHGHSNRRVAICAHVDVCTQGDSALAPFPSLTAHVSSLFARLLRLRTLQTVRRHRT
jgi:hypothetical protein